MALEKAHTLQIGDAINLDGYEVTITNILRMGGPISIDWIEKNGERSGRRLVSHSQMIQKVIEGEEEQPIPEEKPTVYRNPLFPPVPWAQEG